MTGPNLNGPPASIWRRSTIQHSNTDGSFCLYTCERTGEVVWMLVGEFFVADRPRGVQPTGTVMIYLFSQRQQTIRPSGYGFHHTGRFVSGSSNGNIRRPISNQAYMVYRAARAGATRTHHSNHLAPQKPAVAGTGTRRTVVSRERRDKARELHHPLLPQSPPKTTASTTSSSTVVDGDLQDHGDGVRGNEVMLPRDDGNGAILSTSAPPSFPSSTFMTARPVVMGLHKCPTWACGNRTVSPM